MAASLELMQSEARPSYEPLNISQEVQLISRLLDESPEINGAGTKFALATIEPNSQYANLARSIESSVFHEFFDNDPDLMAEEYGPYEQASLFFLVVDTENYRSAGTMRLLKQSESGFKATNDLLSMGLTNLPPEKLLGNFGITDSSAVLEIATIAGSPEYRGEKSDGLTSAAMYRALYQYCKTNNYSDLIAIIDSVPLSLLKAMYLPVEESPDVASPFAYLDASTNSFIHIPVDDVERSMRSNDNALFENLLGTPGLDPFLTISHELK